MVERHSRNSGNGIAQISRFGQKFHRQVEPGALSSTRGTPFSSLCRFTKGRGMRLGWFAALIGIASLAAIVRPDAVAALYQQLYPSDPEMRQALNECFTLDPQFNRLDPAARQACYRHMLPVAAAAPHSPARGNFVDLWRAAGQGHLPQNDIRAEQQNRR
jgi:hypothetical protein